MTRDKFGLTPDDYAEQARRRMVLKMQHRLPRTTSCWPNVAMMVASIVLMAGAVLFIGLALLGF